MIRIKSPEDIAGIQRSADLLAKTFTALSRMVVLGAKPLDLDQFAFDYIRKHGGKPAFLGYQKFPNSLCISVNEVVIHGIPNKRAFVNGDLVGIDCGIELDGYISDAAWTFAIGDTRPELKKLMTVARESLFLGIEAAQPGNRVHDISRAIFRHNSREGYGLVRSYCGHGVGFAVHEDPQVPNYVGSGPNPRLKPGMVIAIEPMVNMGTDDVFVADDGWAVVTRDRKPSVHFEHTIAILESGPVIMTRWNE